MALYNAPFEGCCGLYICYNIGYEESKPTSGQFLNEPAKEHLKITIKMKTKDTAHVGMTLISLNSNQEAWGLGEILEECGYKKLTEEPFFHPGHGRYITLYGFEHHPHRRQSKATPPPTPRSAPVQFFSNSRAKW